MDGVLLAVIGNVPLFEKANKHKYKGHSIYKK
jgi:hypothetical protein